MKAKRKNQMTIIDHYAEEKQRFLENCIQCGLCAEECPILPYTEIGNLSAQEIQEDVFDFLKNGNTQPKGLCQGFCLHGVFQVHS
jgi:heterodisulfide reductase subunit C